MNVRTVIQHDHNMIFDKIEKWFKTMQYNKPKDQMWALKGWERNGNYNKCRLYHASESACV